MVICLEQGADLHLAQLMLLALTVSCFSKIQIGLIFLVPAHLGSPRKRMCVCVSGYNVVLTIHQRSATTTTTTVLRWLQVIQVNLH